MGAPSGAAEVLGKALMMYGSYHAKKGVDPHTGQGTIGVGSQISLPPAGISKCHPLVGRTSAALPPSTLVQV